MIGKNDIKYLLFFFVVNLCVLTFNNLKIQGPMRYCHIDNLTFQIGQTLKLDSQFTFSFKW